MKELIRRLCNVYGPCGQEEGVRRLIAQEIAGLVDDSRVDALGNLIAYGVLMSGDEDDDINEYFRDSAFPPEWQISSILDALNNAEEGLKIREIEHAVNLRQSQIEKVLKLLVVEPLSTVVRIDGFCQDLFSSSRITSTFHFTVSPLKLNGPHL